MAGVRPPIEAFFPAFHLANDSPAAVWTGFAENF